MTYLYFIIAFVFGLLIGWLIVQNKFNKSKAILNQLLADSESKIKILQSELEYVKQSHSEKIIFYEKERTELKQLLSDEQQKSEILGNNSAKTEADYRNLLEKLASQKTEMEDLQKKFTTEFENIAHKILKENSLEFTASNQKNISEILNPLKEKIQSFEQKVQDTHIQGVKDNVSLREEVKKLYELNNKISEEANNLTKALKGDNKKQGNWGEMVLERILERSGLIKGEEYETQFTVRNDENEIIRPDVVIKLPDNKHVVIDSKVSLIAYEQYVNTDAVDEKDRFARLHVESLKNHIKGLSDKNYPSANGIDTPDFVLMFLPIESSFSMAIQQDIDLFNFAWDRRIVIVSPSTLLATLKTIESIWKRAKQTQNALEIAKEGGKLYDKFVGLIEDLKKLGAQLETVQKTYNEANKKLYSGSGNLIGKVEKLRILGAKNSKTLFGNALNQADLSDNQLSEE